MKPRLRWELNAILAFLLALIVLPANGQEPKRITILYDAFGPETVAPTMDWGFSALVEYGGRRILFDTGNNSQIFARNAQRFGADLTRLDAVVISHRHGDHTSGLNHLRKVNPSVKIYTPFEVAFFKAPIPNSFFTPNATLPKDMQYYRGKEPDSAHLVTGTPWGNANFEAITKTTEIFPGFFIVTTRSQKPDTLEMNEISLAIRTPEGLAVVVGCSHPGVEKVLGNVRSSTPGFTL